MEKDKEPGSARFGNFINYYAFNPPERRLQLLPKTLLRDYCDTIDTSIVALDIGSNAGVCKFLQVKFQEQCSFWTYVSCSMTAAQASPSPWMNTICAYYFLA